MTLREWVSLSPKALLSREPKGQRAREVLGVSLPPLVSRTLLTGPHYSCHLHLPFWILKTPETSKCEESVQFGHSVVSDSLQPHGLVNYKLVLTSKLPTTEGQRHLPSASTEIEPHAPIAVDLQHPPREFRVEGGTMCSRESGGTGL